jgi:uncharacterized protein
MQAVLFSSASFPSRPSGRAVYQEPIMRISSLVLAFTLSFASAANAQDAAVSSTHKAAAVELVKVMKLSDEMLSDIMGSMGAMGSDNPMAIQMASVMDSFMKEFLPWSKLEPLYIDAYTGAFTESEIRQLITFYKSPIGQKTIEKQSEIMKATSAMTQKMLMPHMPELQRRIMAKIGGGGI